MPKTLFPRGGGGLRACSSGKVGPFVVKFLTILPAAYSCTCCTPLCKVSLNSLDDSLVSRPEEEEEKGPDFSCLYMCLNHGGIPPPPHTVDILPYARDANIDAKVTLSIDLS